MRTSATGDNGFTLVELLIVLTLIGLLSATVVLAMPDGRDSLRAEAERFAARLKTAQDRAVIEARPMAVRIGDAGYVFERREQGAWALVAGEPFEQQAWKPGTRALVGEAGARIVFDTTGVAEPAELALEREGERLMVSITHDGRIRVEG